MVEMALVAPVLIVLFLIIADGGRMFFAYLEVVGAARTGAQYGAQTLVTAADNSGMVSHALAAAPNLSVSATATNYCCCTSGSTCTQFSNSSSTIYTSSCAEQPPCSDWRRYVQVNTTGTFKTLCKYPGLPSSFTFNAESILRAR